MSKSKRWKNKRLRHHKNTLHDEVYEHLCHLYMEGKGRSRKEDKKKGIDNHYIYSSKTYETYKREGKHFVDWCKDQHPEILHLNQCKAFANDYLNFQIQQGYSAWTIATRKAAIAKLLSISFCDLIATPSRNRANIQRSRSIVERDRHISQEKEAFYAKITSSTGLRRTELLKIRGTDLIIKEENDGARSYYIHVHKGTKGGRKRIAPLVGINEQETTEIANMFLNAGNALVCPTLPNAYDNHYYRGVYARRIYGKHARSFIPKEDRYVLRKERSGEILDKQGMYLASLALGHSRISVVAQNYLYLK